MKVSWKIKILFCIALIVFSSPLIQAGDITFEFGSSTISTESVLSNNSEIYDAYSAYVVGVKAYPFSFLEISLNGEQSVYREVTGLSNVAGTGTLTFIPTKPGSKWSLLLSASVSGRTYHNDFKIVDNNYGEFSAVMGYQLRSNMFVRLGGQYRATAYINTDNNYKRDMDFFAGLNMTLPGKSSFDFEAGFSGSNYTYKDAHLDSVQHWVQDWRYLPADLLWMYRIPDSKENLWLLFLSPRISRSIGNKTGVNVTYMKRLFQNYDGGFLWGENTGNLSPYATIWEGNYISLNIKSFILPKFILNAGIGYWDKEFPITSETQVWSENGITGDNPSLLPITYGEVKETAFSRRDYVSRVYFGIQWPLAFKSGLFLEPSLNIEYTNNRSNKETFDYDNFSVTTGFSVRF